MRPVGRGGYITERTNEPRHRAPVLQFSASRRRSRVVAVDVLVCHVKYKREGEGTRTNGRIYTYIHTCVWWQSGVYTRTEIRCWCRQGIVRLVSDGFSLVRRVGEPAGLWANGAHAPHEGERFKREEPSLSFPPFSAVWCRNSPAARVSLHRSERCAREKKGGEKKIESSPPSGGSAEAFSQLAVMARPAASVSVN